MKWWNFYTPHRVLHVKPQEIVATGAVLEDVKKETVYNLDRFIASVGRGVVLLHNGITTGDHTSSTHLAGKAVDVAFREANGVMVIRHLVLQAAAAGFTELGVYWNGTAYSMHLGWGRVAQWARWRHHREEKWHETQLVVDPKDVEMDSRP